MVPQFIRRLGAFLLALAPVAGLAAHGVQAAQMGATMVGATMDMPMPDDCDGTGMDGDGSGIPTCTTPCPAFAAVLPIPADVTADGIVFTYAIVATEGASLRAPPDPFPPRPTVLT